MPIPELGGVVASALAEVLATQFKLPVIASDTPSADQSEQCLIGTVKLTGELLSGDVKLELPEAFVAMITAALHESEVARITDEEIVDMTGELCNMLAGRIAATLAAAGYSSILSVPTVARGRLAQNSKMLRAPKHTWTNWTCEGHLLKVVVAVWLQVEMSPKILSVDDSKAVRKLLARMFGPFDCELCEAANGEEGLAVAAREIPDLIILDYNMPVMDGVSMLRRLRENANLRRTPVIMLTAESSAENIATVARLGVRDYVTKPFDEELLLAKAARAVPLVARPTHDAKPEPQLEATWQYPTESELGEIGGCDGTCSIASRICLAESLRARGG